MNVTIDLKDLFKKIGKKWPVLVIFAVIGAVLLNFTMVKRGRLSAASTEYFHEIYADAAPELPEYFNESLYSLRCALSENDAEFCEAYAQVYKNYITEYEAGTLTEDPTRLESYMMFMDSYKDVLSVFSGAQRSYYDALICFDNGSSAKGAPVSEFIPSEVGTLQPKWVVIGAFVGILIGAVVLALPYLLTGKLRNPRDMELSFNVPVLATVQAPNAGNQQIDLISTGISILLKKDGLSSVMLTETPGAQAENLKQQLTEKLSAEGIRVEAAEAASNESDSLKILGNAEAAVLVEKIGRSRYTDIEKETERCRQYGTKILGCVVLE